MSIFNTLFNAPFDAFFGIFGMLGGDIALWVFSALAGILFLWIFKLTSNQAAIRRTKDHIAAGFLEVRLFKDDIGQMMKAQGRIFGSSFKYMAHAFKPMLYMILPVLLMLIQLNTWYGFRPLEADSGHIPMQQLFDDTGLAYDTPLAADKVAVVTATFAEGTNLMEQNISLESTPGLKVVTQPARSPSINQVAWRIRALEDGHQMLTLAVGDTRLQREVFVGNSQQFRKVIPVQTRGAWPELWNPALPPLPDNQPVIELTINYPERNAAFLWWEMHWVIVFLILSVVFGFALKGVLGVEI